MMTILLVDANDADASLLASALRVEGFEVMTAKSAHEARSTLAAHPTALTIVDLMLRGCAESESHGSSGLDFARELRTRYPAMRVLLTSAYYLSERQLERADCGVSGFIPKPYDLREVVEFVRNKLAGPPSSRRLWCAEPPSGVSVRPGSEPADATADVGRAR
ncbi:MAG: response regulator [Labilithrix sp.]|nr:response regulator [Labilithrix sp.]MCW5816071.1 response regulator [Labilithrix sp.]